MCLYDVPAQEYPQLLARERRLRETRVTCAAYLRGPCMPARTTMTDVM